MIYFSFMLLLNSFVRLSEILEIPMPEVDNIVIVAINYYK